MSIDDLVSIDLVYQQQIGSSRECAFMLVFVLKNNRPRRLHWTCLRGHNHKGKHWFGASLLWPMTAGELIKARLNNKIHPRIYELLMPLVDLKTY